MYLSFCKFGQIRVASETLLFRYALLQSFASDTSCFRYELLQNEMVGGSCDS